MKLQEQSRRRREAISYRQFRTRRRRITRANLRGQDTSIGFVHVCPIRNGTSQAAASPIFCFVLPQRGSLIVMPSPNSPTLQGLDRLDRSSAEFHSQLSDTLYGEEYQQCVPNFRDDDLVWLVDFLDKVCHHETGSLPLAQANVDARRSRTFKRRCPEMSTRAQKNMWH